MQVQVPRSLRRALDAFGVAVAKRVDERAYYYAVKVRDDAKRRAPVRTGYLRSKVLALKARKPGDGAKIFIPRAPYFWPLHQGHAAPGRARGPRTVAARPFLAAALDPIRDKAPKNFRKVIAAQVDATNRRSRK